MKNKKKKRKVRTSSDNFWKNNSVMRWKDSKSWAINVRRWVGISGIENCLEINQQEVLALPANLHGFKTGEGVGVELV